jgi:hypothetical protein
VNKSQAFDKKTDDSKKVVILPIARGRPKGRAKAKT